MRFCEILTAGLTSTFAPVLILSLYWDRLTNWGAITGMASGFVMNVVWQNMGLAKTVNQCIPAFAVAFLVAFMVSKLSAPPTMEEVRSELRQVARIWKS
jgi:Na+/proline symporter